jgi:hypothetical protein
MPTLADLDIALPDIKEHRRRKRALKLAMPKVRIWVNPGAPILGIPGDSPGDGIQYLGQVDLRDCEQYEFPWKNNEPSSGTFRLRAEHYIAKKIAQIPNDPNMCKNVIITVDMYGGELRWSGLMTGTPPPTAAPTSSPPPSTTTCSSWTSCWHRPTRRCRCRSSNSQGSTSFSGLRAGAWPP